ncbi:metal ABC transporter permease [Gulosibacter sp. 10]|uniref:metal ABC transporter permease n=1 Tax=Gulosibacter sp. 10 TaxID=1255570 RepID=UPI00097E9E2E|nr:metal ABC transporter permease [Gulosibacter sp. 10]SJM50077.1 Manganese ABC transporter, inner membrane permease protein SitD [Gulosibacter sp. 10]
MSFLLGTSLLAVVTALACALPGAFVVLRKSSMLVDAISHAVLPGIVVGYFFTRNLDSPLLIIGAALAGLVVVLGAEWLGRTGLITGDAPQGLIFPALFSIGVILVTLNFANVHLDTHAVLVGDLNLAAFRQLSVGGVSIGPEYLYVMLGVLLLDIAFLAVCYPRLKVTTFDPQFAESIGIRSGALNTAFMFMVSLTVTAAFNAAGAILVIALMIVPPATAYLLSSRLSTMLVLTAAIAAGGALAGFWMAYALNAATSAGMAVFYGAVFVVVLLANRIAQGRRRSASREPSLAEAVRATAEA